MTDERQQVTIYTDGACQGNPGPGGWGIVVVQDGQRLELSGGYRRTTNNRMELLAAIRGLEALPASCSVTVISDSEYLVKAMKGRWPHRWKANGWMRTPNDPALNPDLWERMLVLSVRHQVAFQWVRGHTGHPENERCDRLAVRAIHAGDLEVDEPYEAAKAAKGAGKGGRRPRIGSML